MANIILSILINFTPVTENFARLVAEKLQGEGAQTIEAMTGNPQVFIDAVCTVRNRLESDAWDASNVLDPYYAPRRSTSQEHVQKTFDMLNYNANVNCGTLWFMYSHQDVTRLGIPQRSIVRRYTSPRLKWFGLNYVNK